MSNPKKWSIPTKYRSDMMRSRLEAKWAKTFDLLGIEYYFEPQAYIFDGVSYLPDFYLPQQDIFFEAKGVMDADDLLKINALALTIRKDVVIGYPNGTFQMVDMEKYGDDDVEPDTEETWWVEKDETRLAKCEKCHKWHFHNTVMMWDCRICGQWSKDWPLGSHYGDDNLFEALGVSL